MVMEWNKLEAFQKQLSCQAEQFSPDAETGNSHKLIYSSNSVHIRTYSKFASEILNNYVE